MVKKYPANIVLIWTIMIVQMIIALFLIILFWFRKDFVFSLVLTIPILFIEYGGVLAIISPKITRCITVTTSNIIIDLKNEHIEIPIISCEMISYQRPWPYPKKIFVFTNEKKYVVLPWYIKNFRGMCKSIYEALENAGLESIADKKFKKKYGKGKF